MITPNIAFENELFFQYLRDPDSVSPEWREYFERINGIAVHPLQSQSSRSNGQSNGAVARDYSKPLVSQSNGVAYSNDTNNNSNYNSKNDIVKLADFETLEPLSSISAKIAENMEESLSVPTATSFRTIPVKALDENTQIIYQQFDPNKPFISKRDLLYIQWSRKIDEKTIQTSFRSIIWDEIPVPKGFERIDWWGGHLFEANTDGTSQLVLIDRENQGGSFPAFIMNQIMPSYLTHQFESIVKFFDKGGVKTHEKLPESKNTALKSRHF